MALLRGAARCWRSVRWTAGADWRSSSWAGRAGPGTARALLHEAVAAHGWDTDDVVPRMVDGWTLFDAVSARRPEDGTEPSQGAGVRTD